MNQCIEKARGGDGAATRSLVENLRPRMASMANYYARRCGADADDLLQEAWLGMLEALPNVDMQIGSPEQYLIQRARWRLLDDIKRSRVRKCSPLPEDLGGDLPGKLEPEMDTVFVTEFVGTLSGVHGRIVGCLMDGLTWREAGERLGCSSANIAYHMRQIRKRYLEWLGEAAQ